MRCMQKHLVAQYLARRDQQARKVQQEMMEHKASKVFKAQQEMTEQLVLQEQQELKALKV